MTQVAYSKQQGFLVITVVVILAILASIAMLLSTSTSMDNAVLSRHTENSELDYVAEAGIQHALWLARQANCSNYASLTNQPFGDHSYSVTVTPIDGSPVTFKSTAALDSGANKTIQRSATTVYSAASTRSVIFQPGSEGDDAEIWDQQPNDNYGDANETWVSSANNDTTRSLLRFDLGAIPANAIILEATLFLTRKSGSGSDQPVSAHRIMKSWSENAVSWNFREFAINWDVAGGDFDKNAVATTPVGPANQRYDWNITPLAQGWVDKSYPNYGVVLAAAIAGMPGERFYTSDESDLNKRPGLRVRYVCECGQPCTNPGGSGKNVLLVVGDPASLTPEQADKKALMEGWGHTLKLIATSDTQVAFDTAAAGVDVVYVPELGTTPMNELGSKADTLAKGVITEESRRAIKLGSFELFPFVSTTSINVIDNTHYITETLPTGNVVLSTSTQSFWKLGGTLAPDLHILGELSGAAPGLAYVDVGETVNDGSPAAGRRVKLPWGAYDFDVNLLTDDALEIMKRAIEWGALSSDTGGGPRKVLFVVSNVGGAGPTTEELAHQVLIESWGHTVELIDDDASQSEFDVAAANNDVAYATNDITASRLGNKLVNAMIGVVSSEGNLSDEFGLSSSIGWESGTVVEINDNTHYITSPFATGLLTIFSGSESLAYVTGTLSPDLGQLASSASGYGIVTLDAGASMYGGGTVAGRRVQLPWGGSPALEPNDLTPDGLTILKRALEWGAGAGGTSPALAGYLDEFNSRTCDPAADYSGSDGTLDWSPWAWTEVSESDGPCSGLIQVAADPVVDDSGSFRLRVTAQGIRVRRMLDLSTFTQPALSFDYRLENYPADDFVRLRVSTDDGIIWTEIDRFIGPFDHTEYQFASYDLSALIDVDTLIQLEFNGVGTTRKSYFDNIHVQEAGGGGGGGGPGYNETFEPWSAASNDTWESVDLGAFGVPANAVVEVAVVNSNTSRQYWGGVRKTGSTLDRRLQLHEAEGGGTDVMVMHVQADASSRIEHYSDTPSDVTFILLGYWGSGSFEERWNPFSGDNEGIWHSKSLQGFGVTSGSVTEVLIRNATQGFQIRGGVREVGSTLSRIIDIHEAEGGGGDMATMFVTASADVSASIDVYTEDIGLKYILTGFWSTPPGVFTESYSELSGSPASSATWDDKDLTSFGVPADAVVQIVTANGQDTAESQLGVREKGSSNDRTLNLQEAEAGGDDLASMHVTTDANSTIQWYDQNTGQDHRFYLMGWWVLTP